MFKKGQTARHNAKRQHRYVPALFFKPARCSESSSKQYSQTCTVLCDFRVGIRSGSNRHTGRPSTP
eukprot:3070756-Pleurochrysis_carterae.AAC.1